MAGNDSQRSPARIDEVGVTGDVLTGRGGLILFVRYLAGVGVLEWMERLFSGVRKSRKGQPLAEVFKQMLCFFMDGSSRHLVHFDSLKEDEGYAAGIESRPEQMQSSHAVKRFLRAFTWWRIWLFRTVLQKLFIWRLRVEQPEIIELGIDVMPMDNDEAKQRHGVEPTYKGYHGFAPLQMSWGRYVVDAVLRGGSKHSNHSDTVAKMVRHTVARIRREYGESVPIIIRMDSAFMDQKLFELFEELGVGYISGGKLLEDIQTYVTDCPQESWEEFHNHEQIWDYLEFGDCRGSWSKFRRAFYLKPRAQEEAAPVDGERPETMIYTNLGLGGRIDEQLRALGRADCLQPEYIIQGSHERGCDELVWRALKDFGDQRLPCKRFAPNAVYYYLMLVAFCLFEAFKYDVTAPVLPVVSYATTLRRQLIDNAAKIVRHAGRVTLKVTQATWDRLGFGQLWERSGTPPSLAGV